MPASEPDSRGGVSLFLFRDAAIVDKLPKAGSLSYMKIIEYKTATADSWAALDKEVNKLLTQGYQLYGSPYFGENKIEGAIGAFLVAQAMVKCGLQEKHSPIETIPGTFINP
jgi:hypothetical protein